MGRRVPMDGARRFFSYFLADMNASLDTQSNRSAAFTFLEVIIVIAVIGIMSAMAISSISNGANDARVVVSRQQQATLQSAINGWVTASLGSSATVAEVRAVYNAADSSVKRLELVKDYLDDISYEHFAVDGGNLVSDSMLRLGWHVRLGDWEAGSHPKVDLVKGAGVE